MKSLLASKAPMYSLAVTSIAWVIVAICALYGLAIPALIAGVLAMIISGAPVAVAIGLPSLLFILLTGSVPALLSAHRMVAGVDSFPLIAIPFFIMAGALMNAAQITDKIFHFARTLVGWLPGGLGHVNVGASVIFAGMSGAAVADAGGLGAVEIKAMREAGYDDDFAVGVTAASSTIGPIIPPSLPIVIYGVMANVSIGALFAAGIVPGLLLAVTIMLMVAWYAWKRNYPVDTRFSVAVATSAFWKALPSLLTPVIIIGGILLGIFTPTEAAIAAVIWATLLGVCYRTLTIKKFISVSYETLETTAAILFIVGAAALFAWILTSHHVAEQMATLLLGITENRIALLLLATVLLLVIGCFLETIAAITILTPVLLPVMVSAGVDPVHFGIVMILNLMLGLLTPPLGMVLYVLSRVANVPFTRCVSATMPFFFVLLFALLIVTLVPSISLFIPSIISGP